MSMNDSTLLKPGWTWVKFGDVVRLNTDRCADPAGNGIERYVGLEHIEPEDLRIRRWGLVAEGTTFTNRFQPGQVLFGKRRAYQRKVAVADFAGVCSGDIYVFEPKDERLLPELLPFLCQTERFFEYAVGTSAGSLSPRTNWTQLANYEFALPPLEEQRRIVELLSVSHCLVEADQILVEKSRSLVSSFAKQQLEKYAEDYPSIAIPEITTRLTVGIVVKPAEWYVQDETGVPALRSLNVFPDRLVLSDLVYISKKGHEVHEKSNLQAGDVVIVRTGRPGDAAVIPCNLGQLNCIDLIITTPSPKILAEYLVHYLNSPVGRQQFAAGSAGTAQQHFNVKEFRNLRIPCPPIPVQSIFVNDIGCLKSGQTQAETRYNKVVKIHQRLLDHTLGVKIE